MAGRREGIDVASPSSSTKSLLHTLKGIHFKLVTTTQRLREGLNANADAISVLAERVATLGGEFRGAVERAGASERESVAVQKILRDFQGVLRKAESLLDEARRRKGSAVNSVPGVAFQADSGGLEGDGYGTDGQDHRQGHRQDHRQEHRQNQRQQEASESISRHAIDANDAIIREREAAVTGVSSQIGEVHQIFVDLAGLVSDQGGQVDDIESNIERAKQRTENAVGQVRRAEKKGKKGSCNVLFVTGLAALAVLVLFVVMMA